MFVLTIPGEAMGETPRVPRPSLFQSVFAALLGVVLLVAGIALAIFVFLPLAILVIVLGLAMLAYVRIRGRLARREPGRRNVRVVRR